MMVSLILLLVLKVALGSDIGFFWQITDIHYDHTYKDEDLSCNEAVTNHGKYGDYACDSPWDLVKDSIHNMRRLRKDVDFILWTGDSILHTTEDNLSFEYNDEVVVNITNLLNETFPDVPTFPSLGNYDNIPYSQYPPNGIRIYNSTYEQWSYWIGEEAKNQFLQGGFYKKHLDSGITIVSLNTNLYYKVNKQMGNPVPPDPCEQFKWLEQVLKVAQNTNSPVIINGHVPPGVRPDNGKTWMYEEYNERLNRLIEQHADVIVGMFFAHGHSDTFRLHESDKGSVIQFCAPSVTPWRHFYPPHTPLGPAHNPGIRLIAYDRKSGDVIDIFQYYIDLPNVNKNEFTIWNTEYDYIKDYGIFDMSPKSVKELITRMENRESSEFQLFHKYWAVSVNENLRENCDDACHSRFYCSFLHVDYEKFKECFDNKVSAGQQASGDTIFVFITYFIILYCFEL